MSIKDKYVIFHTTEYVTKSFEIVKNKIYLFADTERAKSKE